MENYTLIIWGIALVLTGLGEKYNTGMYFGAAFLFTALGALAIGEELVYLATSILLIYQGYRTFHSREGTP